MTRLALQRHRDTSAHVTLSGV